MFGIDGQEALQIAFRQLRRAQLQLHGAGQQDGRHVLGRRLEHQLQRLQGRLVLALAEIEQRLGLQQAQAVGRRLARRGQLGRRFQVAVFQKIEVGQVDMRLGIVRLELEDLHVGEARRAVLALQALQVALQPQGVEVGGRAFQRLDQQQLGCRHLLLQCRQPRQAQQGLDLAGMGFEQVRKHGARLVLAAQGQQGIAAQGQHAGGLRRIIGDLGQHLVELAQHQPGLAQQWHHLLRRQAQRLCFAQFFLGRQRFARVDIDAAQQQARRGIVRLLLQQVLQLDDGGARLALLAVLLRVGQQRCAVLRAVAPRQQGQQQGAAQRGGRQAGERAGQGTGHGSLR